MRRLSTKGPLIDDPIDTKLRVDPPNKGMGGLRKNKITTKDPSIRTSTRPIWWKKKRTRATKKGFRARTSSTPEMKFTKKRSRPTKRLRTTTKSPNIKTISTQ